MLIKFHQRFKQNSSLLILFLLLICILPATPQGQSSRLKIINVVDNQYQKSFYIRQKSQGIYLNFTCKQKNMLSLLISTEPSSPQAPRFNIHGDSQNIPKMAKSQLTNLNQCPATISLNTSAFIQIRRLDSSSLIMSLDSVTFKSFHNKFVIKDESIKWGLGQRFQRRFSLKDGRWTIWNRDKPWKIDEGRKNVSHQTYGHHPVYLARERQTRLYHLLYFKNTHGMQIQATQNTDLLTFHSLGGNIHLILIIGQKDPEKTIEQYHAFIGGSHIPPFWSLGFHQSRWGYSSLLELQQVLSSFNETKLPIDCIWTDLQYMNGSRIFTVNQYHFPPKKMQQLFHKYQVHYIPLLDVAVALDDLPALSMGLEMNVFLVQSDSLTSEYYVGEVWPGEVMYIDYLHPNASEFWKCQLERLNKKINFSGIWLDMNEPTNFKGGQDIYLEQFRIQSSQNLNMMTINANLEHYSNQSTPLLHHQVHAYYGHLSTVPTFQYLNKSNQRPFIISRSTSVGSGMFAGHWTGDNVADWEFLRLSINGNFLFQIFGIQMVGADICGFYKDTTEELCARWMQLGSFYPFARNHNHKDAISQEPYELGSILLQTSQYALGTRYAFLKQYYTTIVMKQGKGSIFRPLNFQFYQDQNVYEQQMAETQFLIGCFLMVAPIVYEDNINRYIYFPGDDQIWYWSSKCRQYIILYKQQWRCNIEQTSIPSHHLSQGRLYLDNKQAYASIKPANKLIQSIRMLEVKLFSKLYHGHQALLELVIAEQMHQAWMLLSTNYHPNRPSILYHMEISWFGFPAQPNHHQPHYHRIQDQAMEILVSNKDLNIRRKYPSLIYFHYHLIVYTLYQFEQQSMKNEIYSPMKGDHSVKGLSQIMEQSYKEQQQSSRYELARLSNQQFLNQYIQLNNQNIPNQYRYFTTPPICEAYQKFNFNQFSKVENIRKQIKKQIDYGRKQSISFYTKEELKVLANKKLVESAQRQKLSSSRKQKREVLYQHLSKSRKQQQKEDKNAISTFQIVSKNDSPAKDATTEQTADDIFVRLEVVGQSRDKIKKKWYGWGEKGRFQQKRAIIQEWNSNHSLMKSLLQLLLQNLNRNIGKFEVFHHLKVSNQNVVKALSNKQEADKRIQSSRILRVLRQQQTKLIYRFGSWFNKFLLDQRQLEYIDGLKR